VPSGISGVVPSGHKPTIRVLCDNDERFTGKKCLALGSGAIMKLLDEIPIVDIGEVIDAKTIDMVLSRVRKKSGSR
jgi:hypothetical protein